MEKESIYTFDREAETNLILNRLLTALNQDPRNPIHHEMLEDNWGDWLENIHDQGVLLGLELAKKAWGEGHGLNDIMENIAHYKGEIEEYES